MKILFLFLVIQLGYVQTARSEMPTKVKALITMPAYGAGGGALLGFASMAFGAEPKAIAQGASLGLYAGLLFATYIIVSYKYKTSAPPPKDAYPDSVNSPYGDEGGYGADPYGGGPYADEPMLFEKPKADRFELRFGQSKNVLLPKFEMNLVSIGF